MRGKQIILVGLIIGLLIGYFGAIASIRPETRTIRSTITVTTPHVSKVIRTTRISYAYTKTSTITLTQTILETTKIVQYLPVTKTRTITFTKRPRNIFIGLHIHTFGENRYSDDTIRWVLPRVIADGFDYVVVPYWVFQENKTSTTIIDEKEDRILNLKWFIRKCKERGLKVALYIFLEVMDGSWRGDIQPNDVEEWFHNYIQIARHAAEVARETNSDMMIIGCEMKSLERVEYINYWKSLINSVSKIFNGAIVYGVNWDSIAFPTEENQKFISKLFSDERLSYIGISGYFPLTQKSNPTIEELKRSWRENWLPKMELIHEMTGKKILFTEIGYTSLDKTNTNPWSIEVSSTLDFQEQADCYRAFFETFTKVDWFAGAFLFYESIINGIIGTWFNNDFNVLGKPAEEIIRQYFGGRHPNDYYVLKDNESMNVMFGIPTWAIEEDYAKIDDEVKVTAIVAIDKDSLSTYNEQEGPMAFRLVVKCSKSLYHDIIFKILKRGEKASIYTVTDFDELKPYEYPINKFPNGFTNYTIKLTRSANIIKVDWYVNDTLVRSSKFNVADEIYYAGAYIQLYWSREEYGVAFIDYMSAVIDHELRGLADFDGWASAVSMEFV